MTRGEPADPANAVDAVRESRRTVTILFTDVADSTGLGERLDPEAMRHLMRQLFAVLRAAIERHGGTVEKFIGDAVMAVFGLPTLHEDDALRAVRAALEIEAALAGLNAGFERDHGVSVTIRTGIATGLVVAGDPASGETLVTGDAVNTAARLQQAAAGGEVLISDATIRLVRHAVDAEALPPMTLRGKTVPITVHRLRGLLGAGEVPREEVPFVGRQRELRNLADALERVTTDQACLVFTVLGPAGVGKSRLIREFQDRAAAAGARILRGRCLPYGEGITYWPIGEIVRDLAGIVDSDPIEAARSKLATAFGELDVGLVPTARVTSAIGLSAEPASQEEVFWAIRKVFEALAARQPLVVIIEDIHWAEPSLLDLLEHVADWSRDSPILLVCPARPELLEVRPGWGGGRVNATTILLDQLSAEGTAAMTQELLGGPVDGPVLERIFEATEGNPLFVEELVAMLREEAHIRLVDGRWSAAVDSRSIPVPSTVSALIAARLDRLDPVERNIAERAAVVGRVFEQPAVAELAPEMDLTALDGYLRSLVRKELIRPDRGSRDDETYRFRHILIRDAAYEALPKAERADLHERFAAWLVRVAADRLVEMEEIIGYHLEQAHRYRAELGDRSPASVALGVRAAERLAAAGRRSFDRGDMPAAAGLLRRAVGLLLEDSIDRLELIPDLSFAEFSSGRLVESAATLEGAIAVARAARRDAIALRFELTRAQLEFLAEGADCRGPEKIARDAIESFERIGDTPGLIAAWELLATVCWFRAGAMDALQARDRARAIERDAGAGRAHRRIAFFGAECYGPHPLTTAIPKLESELAAAAGDPLVEGQARFTLSGLYAMHGRMAEARSSYQRVRQIFEELGLRIWVSSSSEIGAVAELAGGDLAIAERLLRQGISELDELGAHSYRLTHVALLASALQRQGRFAEAIRAADEILPGVARDDNMVFTFAGSAKAASLAALGDTDAALAMSRIALEHASASDFVSFHADALIAHASVCRAMGDDAAALAAYREALAMYEAKGHLPGAARARAALGGLGR